MILKASDAGLLEFAQARSPRPAFELLIVLAESIGEIGENDLKFAVSGGAVIVENEIVHDAESHGASAGRESADLGHRLRIGDDH